MNDLKEMITEITKRKQSIKIVPKRQVNVVSRNSKTLKTFENHQMSKDRISIERKSIAHEVR